MEFNKSAEINEPPLLAIGRQSYETTSSENESQTVNNAWSHMDCNGVGPNSVNVVWQPEWSRISGDFSQQPERTHISGDFSQHTQSLQSQHRAKRQHRWGHTPEEWGLGPSMPQNDSSMVSVHVDHLGRCEAGNAVNIRCEAGSAVNIGFDSFPPAQTSSSSRPLQPIHGLMMPNSLRQATASGAASQNIGVGQGIGLNYLYGSSDWNVGQGMTSIDPGESNKGKNLDNLHSHVSGSTSYLLDSHDQSCYSDVLASQFGCEKGKSRISSSSASDQNAEVHGDSRGAFKRKLSPIDLADSSPLDSSLATRNEIPASRAAAFAPGPDPGGIFNFHISNNASSTLEDPQSSCRELLRSDSQLSVVSERIPDSARPVHEVSMNLQTYTNGMPSDMQSQSHHLFTRRSVSLQAHSLSRVSDSTSGNPASGRNVLPGRDHWPAVVERGHAQLLPMADWGPNRGPRRNDSLFSSPGTRERWNSQEPLDGGRLRRMSGRALDWAMATAAAPAALENRLASQFQTGRDVDLPESSARISQAASSLFNSSPSQHISLGSSSDETPPGSGQRAGRYPVLSSSRAQREVLYPAPVQSVLGLPFRGLHSLRVDGEYRRQFLSEILSAMHHAFRNEDFNIEELVMMDPAIIYGSAGEVHDQHRDMRLDVDNMTYEELLALEERIGNVSTGLDEERISLCLRESKYSSLDAAVAAISQESDIKCSICQEEFVEEDEMGRLDCGHGYHSSCIKQWLLQKNECPICKASAYTKSE
ncbi:hypothetical protein KP509_26G008400 [Ceratopteris richardii]|uniref:RING-type E3 ubiquitin transferase n=1 Tax=Ceratopteris richardii TaxID=49495 RepID=A0A8T2RJG8_CERRI|nr:hypothetical protein KP509_26G008400 [Ceratopteris richardii]